MKRPENESIMCKDNLQRAIWQYVFPYFRYVDIMQSSSAWISHTPIFIELERFVSDKKHSAVFIVIFACIFAFKNQYHPLLNMKKKNA